MKSDRSACDAGHDHDDDYNNENNDDNNEEEEEEEEGLGGYLAICNGWGGSADEASANSNLTPSVTGSIPSTAALTEARGTQNEAQGPSQPTVRPQRSVGLTGPVSCDPPVGSTGAALSRRRRCQQERATQAGLAFADESANPGVAPTEARTKKGLCRCLVVSVLVGELT